MGVLSGINTTNFPCTLNSVQRQLLLGSHLKHNCEMLVSTCPSPWVTDMHSCIMDTYLYRGITICKKKNHNIILQARNIIIAKGNITQLR